jgi:hypothetical protein
MFHGFLKRLSRCKQPEMLLRRKPQKKIALKSMKLLKDSETGSVGGLRKTKLTIIKPNSTKKIPLSQQCGAMSMTTSTLNTSKRSFSNTPSIIRHNNEVFTKPIDIANAINDAFLKKVRDLRGKVNENADTDPKERLQTFLSKRNEVIPEFDLKSINKRKLRKLLKKRKGNRSCGIDYIDGYSIKLAAPLIEDIILHLVNLSIERSLYPSLWKVNKVSPQFKKGDKTLGENWRPVTDIVFVSKLAEAAVYEQVETHFTSNNLWHPNHHGFKANH